MGMPYPELLAGESMKKIIGTEEFSLSVTTRRVIQINRSWKEETSKVLQLDEIDSSGTHKRHNPMWIILAAVASTGGLIGSGNARGNDEKAGWVIAGMILAIVFGVIYGFSRKYMVYVKSKTDMISLATERSGLPLLQSFLQVLQTEVQEAKRQPAPAPTPPAPATSRLQALKDAFDKGLISAKEYESKRLQILDDM